MPRRFNLQPWRAERRKYRNKQFYTTTLVLMGFAILLFSGYYLVEKHYVESQEEGMVILQRKINSYKKAEKEVEKIKALNEEITREIEVMQALQHERALTVKVLNYIALNIPSTVFLNEIKFKDNVLTLTGVAKNESGISEFLRKFQNFSDTDTAKLISIIKARSTSRYEVVESSEIKDFVLEITMKSKILSKD